MQSLFETDKPIFPLIRSSCLSGYEEESLIWLSCLDVFRLLQLQCATRFIERRCKTLLYVELKLANVEWNGESWTEKQNSKPEHMFPFPRLEEFITFALRKTRLSTRQKQEAFQMFQIKTITDAPIECNLLEFFTHACPYRVETQYRIGKYRVDAFLPRLSLAIQIDEHGHKQYDQNDERTYDEVLRDHNIVCLRFVPNENSSPFMEACRLIQLVWAKSQSPEMKLFSLFHRLAPIMEEYDEEDEKSEI